MVLFPEPDGPTIAVDVPDFMVKLASVMTSLAVSGAVGYRNFTWLK